MMTETKRPDGYVRQDTGDHSTEAIPQPLIDLRGHPSPEVLRLLAIGSLEVVNSCVLALYSLGYARPEDWSQPLPTVNPGEVMRILTKRVMLSD
jgi:hypothetical protein